MSVVEEVVTLRDDILVWPTVTALTTCLCQELVSSGLPPVCLCAPVPGADVALDYVTEDAGMAWVRLAAAFPTLQFPAQATAPSCVTPLAFTLDVGVAYCAPVPEPDGSPPGLAALFDATRLQLAAMAAARRAIVCCLGTSARTAVLGQYTPYGPAGGVVGGWWTVAVLEEAVRG